jgi:hypothetical protein
VAPDHSRVSTCPEYFIQGNADDARKEPASFVEVAGKVFACGRDPYFPAWPDVLQLNASCKPLRATQVLIDDVAAHAIWRADIVLRRKVVQGSLEIP